MSRINSYDPDAVRPVVGSRWAWGTDLLTVTGVLWNGEEWWIETQHAALVDLPVSLCPVKRQWNDVSLFWENAHRVALGHGPGPNPKGATRRGPARPDELSSAV